MKKGFTLAELMVSIAVLALTMAAAGTIFKMSIQAYRTANATTEIMRNLRAITDQLNADFKGLRKDALLAIWFEKDSDGVRYDQVVFFANGDFQSVRQYGDPAKTVAGNVARLYYGQANDHSILARKQKMLTADASLVVAPEPNNPDEYEIGALALIKAAPLTAFLLDAWTERPKIILNPPQNLHMLMCKGVRDFRVELLLAWGSGGPEEELPWFPPDPPAFWGESHLRRILFNIPQAKAYPPMWSSLPPFISLKAIKFTFTLYDSKRIIKNGMTFTHIVYIGD